MRPATHHFNEDIRDITLSHKEGVSDEAAAEHIRQHIPEHDVLLAGFPCQRFSLAGVSKKTRSGGRRFCLDTQGTLFLMWCALSTRVVRRCLCSKRQKPEKSRPG
ncbi:DNA cytosine methyltransferase [Escherichia coli]